MQSDNSNEKKPATSSQNSSESPSDDLITLYVKNRSGETNTISISQNSTIKELYHAVADQLYGPDGYSECKAIYPDARIQHIRMTFAGKALLLDKTINDYDIKFGHTLHFAYIGINIPTTVVCTTNNLKFVITYEGSLNCPTLEEELTKIVGVKCESLWLKKKKEFRREGESEYVSLNENRTGIITGKVLYAKFNGEVSRDKITLKFSRNEEGQDHYSMNPFKITTGEVKFIISEDQQLDQVLSLFKPSNEILYNNSFPKLSTQTLILSGAMIGGGGALCACLTLSHKFPKHPNHVLLTEAVTSALAGAVAGGLLTYVAGLLYNYFTQLPERQNGHDRSQ